MCFLFLFGGGDAKSGRYICAIFFSWCQFLGHFWAILAILGHFWTILVNFGSFLGHLCANFFVAKNVSLLFLLPFGISDPQESEWWRHKVMVPLLTYREQFHDMKGRIDKCEARRADYDRWSKPSCQCCFQWFTYNWSCMSVCMWRKSDQILFLRKNFFKKKFWIFFSKFSFEILLEIFRWKIFCLKLFFWFFLVTTRQSHPVRAREFLKPGLVTTQRSS